MGRKEELIKFLCKSEDEKRLFEPIIEEFLFLETQLTELKKLPFIRVNPSDPAMQKSTPAAKQYKELLQQYTNLIKVLAKAGNVEVDDEESPLRKWVKAHVNSG